MWGYTCNISFSGYINTVEVKLLKINSRWHRIDNVYGRGELLATHYDNNANPVNLLVSDNYRQLYTSDGKILDITDNYGVKRTYIYQKVDDEVHGKMLTPKFIPQEIKPLVVMANWVTKDLIPKVVELVINPKHKDAIVRFVDRTKNLDIYTEHNISNIRAENFDNILGGLVPQKITMTTTNGQEIVCENLSDNLHYANVFNITRGNPGMENLRVLV